ncbi:MAG TPA: sugar ABC transporter permease [Anaerolineales bacterium]|nr:sugar ABC transporter permease [Anaerolineales bacterium]
MQSDSVLPGSKSESLRPSIETRFKRQVGLLLISPWLVGLLVFKLAPILTSLVFSFTDYQLLHPGEAQFIGFQNYRTVFQDATAGTVLWQTVRLALIILPLQLAASICVAGLLGDRRLWLRNTVRTLFFLPSIIPAFAATLMWRGYLDPGMGWIGFLLKPLGLDGLSRQGSAAGLDFLLPLTSLWTIGPSILILLGAFQTIPHEIYEAAKLDGAGRLRRFISMTVPLITPAIFFSLVLNLTAVFGGAILLDRGSTYRGEISSYDGYVNYVLLDLFRVGYASSLAWVFFLIVLLVILILFGTSRYWVYFPERER